MSIPWGDIAALSTAGLSTLAAGGSWFAAHRANKTAAAVARIEEKRWHADLTPQFTLELDETGNGQALLGVHLAGPDSLGHLDSISIEVGNDDRDHELLHPEPNVTQADIDAFVWGPFKFSHGANGTDEHGRGPEPFPLAVGTGTQRAMQRTRPGYWMERNQDRWQGEYAGKPIRLVLTCHRGDKKWVVTRHLENPVFGADV
ncbi:hypothetical protein [Streptomyces sp. NPDC048669]|uniref:hypothetical protein n=1 Tax=Streptomyces sp. NPDC048669 TaxID=3155267 RepID=UPI003439FA8F